MADEKTTTEAKQESKPVAAKPATKTATADRIAVVQIRGILGMRHDVRQALDILRLRNKHVCVIIPDNKVNQGLLRKVKDVVAYGPVSEEVLKELNTKRKPVAENVFRLAPPRGGFSRKGIKIGYQIGGTLGRRPSMDDLLRRMM